MHSTKRDLVLAGLAADGSRSLSELSVLIPAWQPDLTLMALVADLVQRGFGAVVVVDDGSRAECEALFAELSTLPAVEVLHHAVNLGKGRALKTGFNHLLNAHPEFAAVVTADGDGQHTPADIERVARALLDSGSRPVLGSRKLEKDVPLRSRIGNVLTREVFGFLTGASLSDTQTGLRGLPFALLPELLPLEGERYEYEMTMLAHLCRAAQTPLEVPIATVYIENNRGSHFNPVWDSMRIYFVLVRFYASSLIAAGIDLAGFWICYAFTHQLLLSVVVGRISSLVNFAVNRRFVFRSRGSVPGSLGRYYLLAAAVAAISYVFILTLHTYADWDVFAAKIIVDIVLSLISFSAQRTFVFRRGESL